MRRTGLIPCLWFIAMPSARRRIPSRTSLMYSLVIVVIHRELEWLWMDPFRIVLWVQSWCVMSLQRRWWFWSPSECPKKLVAKRLYVSMVIEWYVERLQLWKQAGEIGRRLWRQWVIIIIFLLFGWNKTQKYKSHKWGARGTGITSRILEQPTTSNH